MTEHDHVQRLLPLAASGDLGAEEQRELQRHLAGCEPCRRALEELEAIAAGLRAIPTPQPSEELVAQVRAMTRTRLARRTAIRTETAVLAPLVLASWIAALATWPLSERLVAWLFTGWHLPSGPLANAVAAYSISAWLLAVVSVLTVGMYARKKRRTG